MYRFAQNIGISEPYNLSEFKEFIDATAIEKLDNIEEERIYTMKNESENGFDIVDFQDLDEADLNAIKGDTIGDTVYSSKWILQTLIALSKVFETEWSETLESELCMLWDMTAEKDVALFLKDNNFLEISEFTLKTSTEPRLTEIILGIIGNMCCHPIILESVANCDNLTSIIFRFLSTDDTETLIQILRLLQIFVWDIHKNRGSKWLRHLKSCQFLSDGISFILQSSTNENLLMATVDLLQSISSIEKPDESSLLGGLVKIDQLVPALVECFWQFIPKHDANYSRSEFQFIDNWLTIFSNIIQSGLKIFSSDGNDENAEKLMKVLSKILQPYASSGQLFPLEDRLATCIHDCVEMTSWLQRNNKNNNDPAIVGVIVTIMHEIRSAIRENSEINRIVNMDGAKELSNYLEEYCLETLRTYEENELINIVRHCHKDVIECLMDVAEEYSQSSPDAVAKLLRVESLCLDR